MIGKPGMRQRLWNTRRHRSDRSRKPFTVGRRWMSAPIAALCVFDGTNLSMDAMVANSDGTKVVRGRMFGPVEDAEVLEPDCSSS